MFDHKRNLQTDTTPASSVDYVNLDRRYENIKLSRKRIYASDTVSVQIFPSPFPLEFSLLLAHNSTPVQDLHHLLLLLLTSCLLLHETHLKFSRGFSSQALLLLSYDVVFGAWILACFFHCSCCDTTASAIWPPPPSIASARKLGPHAFSSTGENYSTSTTSGYRSTFISILVAAFL
jgi:hypothetical protein